MQDVITRYGVDGTSSDESDIDDTGGFEPVFLVHTLPWRRDITDHLKVIDDEVTTSRKLIRKRGGIATRRVRGQMATPSIRAPVRGLPESMYDSEWLRMLDSGEEENLEISDEVFQWREIRAE